MLFIRALTYLLLASSAIAQPFVYRIDSFAGRQPTPNGIAAADVALPAALCVTQAPDGSIYICAGSNGHIFRIAPNGLISTVFGSGVAGTSSGAPLNFGDGGPATEAQGVPIQADVDAQGNIYLVQSSRLRKIDTDGVVTTILGGLEAGFSGDGGPAADAQVRFLAGVAIGSDDSIYLSDSGNNRVRRITPDGIIRTVAGGGPAGRFADGIPAVQSQIFSPRGLEIDAAGNLYFAERTAHRVRKVSPDGTISTIAGNTIPGFSGDGGPAPRAQLQSPRDVAVAPDGSVYIVAATNNRVRHVSPDGVITTIAGNGQRGFDGDGGPATAAQLNSPRGIALMSDGGLLIADGNNTAVRLVSPAGMISTIAGGPRFNNPNGPASDATLYFPNTVRLDPAGSPLIADTFNHVVRRVRPDLTLETVAGNGVRGPLAPFVSAPDNPMGRPRDLVFDSRGSLYVTEWLNHWVRIITPNGSASVFAGTRSRGFSGDGQPAELAELSSPRGLAIDAQDNLYISDTGNGRIRRVRNGIIEVFPPGPHTPFDSPRGLDFDAQGNLYVAETFAHRILKISPEGQISVFAGTGQKGHSGDGGAALSASLNEPHRIKFDPDGYLYIGDSYNHVVRMITPQGIIHTIAGRPLEPGNSGDGGPALDATLNLPKGIDIRPNGEILFSDNDNHRIRALRPEPRLAEASAVNAASFRPLLAPGAIVSLFGTNLAGVSESSRHTPLPTRLSYARIVVRDSAGVEREQGMFFASKTQVNFFLSRETALGQATITVIRDNGSRAEIEVEVAATSPGLFQPMSYLRVNADGSRESGPVGGPVDLGGMGDTVFLTVFATGLRSVDREAVTATVGGEPVPVTFAGPHPVFLGLDQINLGPLSRSMSGRGPLAIVITVAGEDSNPLSLILQ